MKSKSYDFKKLTPINDVDLEAYEEALDFIFTEENNDIKNVAISGPYSAGKSSVIETYKTKHPKRKYTHISLSHFDSSIAENHKKRQTPKVGDESNDNLTEAEGVILEGKILNQLIHQTDRTKIPQSNFKLKHDNSFLKPVISVFLIVLFFMMLIYLLFFKTWSAWINALKSDWLINLLYWTLKDETLLLSGSACIILVGIAIYKIINAQRNRNVFKRLSFQGNEIEIFEEGDDSYFDKYLNEVLYLFENSGADVIVFEDMDRYNTNQIFGKLKEINTLINNKREIKKKKPIRFFYLLRDDVFISKDRTKFFDFIIPIIPVIDGSNAYDKFIKYFKHDGLLSLFNKNFLQEISLYIDDLRILKNIFNEFIIYYQRLQPIDLVDNKLLAIIVYKNIFPKDFSDLQLESGFVHTLFANKKTFINHEVELLNGEIERVTKKIKLSQKESLESLNELEALYVLGNYSINSIAGKGISSDENPIELIERIKENPDEVYYQFYHGRSKFNVEKKLRELENDEVFKKRKRAIEQKQREGIDELKLTKQELENKIKVMKNDKLKKIITKDNIDMIFKVNFENDIGDKNEFKEIKASPYFPLIRYLLRNGYIDEEYSDYMTPFYEDSISRIDKNFLLGVTDQLPKEYSYELKDPKLVLSRLSLFNFEDPETLNFDLLCHLLQTKSENEVYLIRFLEQLKKALNFEFIKEFLKTNQEKKSFIKEMNIVWPGIFDAICDESDFTYEQKKQYAIDSLYYSSENEIKKLDENNVLSNFISNSSKFLKINKPNIEVLISRFKLMNIKFKLIDYDVANKDLFVQVYENNLYEINFELISMILEEVYDLTPNDDFNNKNYTLIRSKQTEALNEYVNLNIDKYIKMVLDNCNECITDDEKIGIEVLNNEEINEDNKNQYISCLDTKLEDINRIENRDLWKSLIKWKVVRYTESNILYYYEENELDSYLIDFINSDTHPLYFNKELIGETFRKETKSAFFNSLVACNDILNARYEYILQHMGIYYSTFTKKEIDEDKLFILIKLMKIAMTEENLMFMREQYPSQIMNYISYNIKNYSMEVINDENLINEEVLIVLEASVEEKYKIKLLHMYTDEISIIGKGYSNKIKLYILENNFDASDLSELLLEYEKETKTVRDMIKNIALENIKNIISEELPISFDLLLRIFSSDKITTSEKKELLSIALEDMELEQAMKSLEVLQMDKLLGLFNRKHPTFKINEVNERILTTFKSKKWITRFRKDKLDPNLYRAFGRNLKKN